MPVALINGIGIRYEVYGSGSPLLMLAPGGFNSTVEMWSQAAMWSEMDTFETLSQRYKCIAYDRREAGNSSGRVETLNWSLYADECQGLLDHLGVESAFVLGACLGCSVAVAFAARHPTSVRGLLLHWPCGGYRWRANVLARLQQHQRFAAENGLRAVVDLARRSPGISADPRGGLWSSVLARDENFANQFVAQDLDWYLAVCGVGARTLFDRDTVPGAEPEELSAIKVPAFIISGDDIAHPQSAAHYLKECLPQNELWPIAVKDQNAQVIAERLLAFQGLGGSAPIESKKEF
jgi:pimeloyl-ACP methyl ester carboxylesterase